MTVRLRAAAATDVGSVREANEDSYLEAPDMGLYAVADGMGGHAAGEIASREAVAALKAAFDKPAASAATLADAIVHANRIVFEQAAAEPAYAGMGCTLTALALLDERHAAESGVRSTIAVANVGDSRTYLLRDGGLTQVTSDHSWVQEMVRAGELTLEQAEHHPRRSTLTRALGIGPSVEVDLQTVDPVLGDRYVLCSDGLWDEVPEDALRSILARTPDPAVAASELVRVANEAGGRDNITVVVVDVVDGDDHEHALAASAAIAPELAPIESEAAPALPATPVTGIDGVLAKAGLERAPQEKIAQPPLFTWRVGAFIAALVVVVLAAWLAIRATAAQGWWVYLDDGTVTITHGRPPGKGAFKAENGLLTADKLSPADRAQLERGPRRYATKDEAQTAVFNDLVCDAIAAGTFTIPGGGARTCSTAPSTSLSTTPIQTTTTTSIDLSTAPTDAPAGADGP